MVQIKFTDGTIIECELNGSTFLTDEKPVFPSDLTSITIEEDADIIATIQNGVIVECFPPDSRYAFTIIEKPYTQVLEEKLTEMARIQEEQDEVIAEILETL